MLNHGVLDLHVPIPGLRSKPLVTTSVAWLLRLCMLDVMFDEHFELQQPFLRSGVTLSHRFRTAAVASAFLSPFILLFLLMHFALKHLERIYNNPSSLGPPPPCPRIVSGTHALHLQRHACVAPLSEASPTMQSRSAPPSAPHATPACMLSMAHQSITDRAC